MIKRYLLTAFTLLCLTGIALLTLLPLQLAQTGLDSRQYMLALSIWFTITMMILLPSFAMSIKKIWFFKGVGEPVSLEKLESILYTINETGSPVQVIQKRKYLIVTWRYKDPDWCKLMSKYEINKLYELRLYFQPSVKTVIMKDKKRSVSFVKCPKKVKTGLWARSRPFFKVTLGQEWGVENYQSTEAADYSFHAGEIKSPVMGAIINNGWNVRFSLW